jgi:ABC-2 type transport system ATP-binding protein
MFIVEVLHSSKLLIEKFSNINLITDNIIEFIGGYDKMQEVLEFITKNNIKIKRIEKIEPSLENLFMEVVK